jgi:DNA-nicking Smr family endonuclease
MGRKKITEDESALFQDAMKKLDNQSVQNSKQTSSPSNNALHYSNFTENFLVNDWIQAEDKIQSPNNESLKKLLKKNGGNIDGTFDMHGLTVKEAAYELDHFFAESMTTKAQILLIIHGKGLQSENQRPVLKNAVVYWLKYDPRVKSYCSANQGHGGTGALYVLLRRNH